MCKPKPELTNQAVAATAINCADNAARAAASMACDKGDAAGCYRIGMCFKNQLRAGAPQLAPSEREGTIITAMTALGAACDRHVAIACMEHAELFEKKETESWQAEKSCADVTNACHLGNEQGCSACVACNQKARP